jgi:hypothetical protein
VSPAEIEADGGMPVAQVRELMLALGLCAPDAAQPSFTLDEARALTGLWRHRDVWPSAVTVQIARLYGRLVARIAQA